MLVGDLRGEVGVELGEGGVENPHVGLGEEDGGPPAEHGQPVALGAWDPADQAFASESAQVIGHPAGAAAVDQLGYLRAQGVVRQACEEMLEGA
jgi:hypothetical protein